MLNLCSTLTLNKKLPLTRSLIPIKIHFFLILLKKPLLVPRMPSWEYSSCQLRCIGSFFLTLCWLFAQISSFEKLVWDNPLDLTWIWYVNFLTAGQFFQQVYLFLDKLGRWVGCCQLGRWVGCCQLGWTGCCSLVHSCPCMNLIILKELKYHIEITS